MDVFYFWESVSRSRHQRPGYLELCIKTWRRNIPGAQVILINHENLKEYSGGRVEVERLKAFSLPLQSDVAAISVLAERPGLFLDADTIIFPGFDLSRFSESKLTMFGDPIHWENHATNFFFSPHAGNPLLLEWLLNANRRIETQTQGGQKMRWWLRRKVTGKAIRVPWNYLGNAIIDPLLKDKRFEESICLRDSAKRGYVQTQHFSERHDRINSYHDLWFGTNIQPIEVFEAAKDYAVCLQNSWTPAWYSALDPDEVLADRHLVSRVIRLALGFESGKPTSLEFG